MWRARSLALLALLIGGSWAVTQSTSAQDTGPFADLRIAPGALVPRQTGDLAKLGHDLIGLLRAAEAGDASDGPPAPPYVRVRGGLVAVDVVASGEADLLLADLETLGLENGAAYGQMVSGRIPIRALREIAALSSLRFAHPAAATTSVGSVTSQGDVSMRADIARASFSVDGTGTIVGALSDSYDCIGGAATDVATGDLPAGVVVLQEEVGCGSGSDEGRAMLQLVHDVAPGAGLAFHSAFNGQADFAQGIIELASAGADSIVDDIIYFAEPMFQDGIIAQAVDTVVAGGATYFSSAGNGGRIAYEGDFRDGGLITVGSAVYTAHDFDPGPGVDIFQQFTLPRGARVIFSLQWDEPFFSVSGAPGSANDVDIFIVNAGLTQVRAGSTDANLGGDPVEFFSFANTTGPPSTTFNVLIGKFNAAGGPDPGQLKYVVFRGVGRPGPIMAIDQFDTASGTVYGHSNAAGAEAVGAAWYEETPEFGTDPPLLEPFSSAGPTPILFTKSGVRLGSPEVRQKPEIVAPDGTDTTFFGSDTDGNGFPNFFGTSAAAPHAAAVAALLIQANPTLSPQDLYSVMEGTAIDMGVPGIDFDSGAGLVQADAAVAAVLGPHVRIITDGSTALGVIELGATVDTTSTGLDDVQTVLVTSGPAELFIRTDEFTDGTNVWDLGTSTGALDVAVWEYSTDPANEEAWVVFTDSTTLFPLSGAPLPTGATLDVFFRLTAPTESSSALQHSTSVTMVPVVPP